MAIDCGRYHDTQAPRNPQNPMPSIRVIDMANSILSFVQVLKKRCTAAHLTPLHTTAQQTRLDQTRTDHTAPRYTMPHPTPPHPSQGSTPHSSQGSAPHSNKKKSGYKRRSTERRNYPNRRYWFLNSSGQI